MGPGARRACCCWRAAPLSTTCCPPPGRRRSSTSRRACSAPAHRCAPGQDRQCASGRDRHSAAPQGLILSAASRAPCSVKGVRGFLPQAAPETRMETPSGDEFRPDDLTGFFHALYLLAVAMPVSDGASRVAAGHNFLHQLVHRGTGDRRHQAQRVRFRGGPV